MLPWRGWGVQGHIQGEPPLPPNCAPIDLARQELGEWASCCRTGAYLPVSLSLIYLSLWIISLIPAPRGSTINCKDSQGALLWHRTQIPFPLSSCFHRACPNAFVLSPDLALSNKWKGPWMTNTAHILGGPFARKWLQGDSVLYEYSLMCKPAHCSYAFLHSNLPMNANESCLK